MRDLDLYIGKVFTSSYASGPGGVMRLGRLCRDGYGLFDKDDKIVYNHVEGSAHWDFRNEAIWKCDFDHRLSLPEEVECEDWDFDDCDDIIDDENGEC